MIERKQCMLWLLAGILWLLPAGTIWATSCEGECQGTDCLGGCVINSLNCGTTCTHDGCPGTALCKEFGGETHECYHETTDSCSREGLQLLPVGGAEQPFTALGLEVRRSAEWSVIEYEADDFTTMAWPSVRVLSTSNHLHAERAVDQLYVRQREESTRLRERVTREGLRVAPATTQKRRLHYSISPTAGCVRASLSMAERQLGPEIPDHATVFVRATVNADGRIAGADLLHSDDASGVEALMVDFLKRHAQLERTDGGDGPYEAMIVFFSGTGGTAGWIVTGSKLLL